MKKKQNICVVLLRLPSFQESHQDVGVDLAETLALEGHAVNVLSVHPSDHDAKWMRRWHSRFLSASVTSSNPIHFIPLKYRGPQIRNFIQAAVDAYHVFQWLQENESNFDVVYFTISQGIGYYSLLAKNQGWVFQRINFFLDIQHPTLWKKQRKHLWIDHFDDLVADFLERECVRLSSHFVRTDREIWGWMKEKQWKLPPEKSESHPKRSKVLNNHSSNQDQSYPLVSICVTHYNRPHLLSQLLHSIRSQDYPYFEVILVDDASTLEEAKAYLQSLELEFSKKGWIIIRNPKNLFPGAARNLAASRSKGQYLLFMDDDNYAKDHQVSTFVQVAMKTHADIVTCAMDVFAGQNKPSRETLPLYRFVPMGAAVSLGLHYNIFGDMNALIKKEVFEELKGLSEDHGKGGEDWEFFAKAVLRGYRLEVIPLPLFWYRNTPSSLSKVTAMSENIRRGIRCYLQAVPEPLQGNLILSQIQQEKLNEFERDHYSVRKQLKRAMELISARLFKAVLNPKGALKKIRKRFFS